MAIAIKYSSTGSDYKTSTTISLVDALPRADIAAGDVFIACAAADTTPTFTTLRITDSVTSNYVDITIGYQASSQNFGNVAVAIRTGTVSSLPTGSDNLNVTLELGNSGEAQAAAVYLVSGLSTVTRDVTAGSTGSSGSPSSGATATLSQANEIAIGVIGTEGPNDDSQGSWTTGTGYVSGNELFAGTNANGATANICISTAAEIVSATDAQTAAKTNTSPRDWAALVATFEGESAGGISIPVVMHHMRQQGMS